MAILAIFRNLQYLLLALTVSATVFVLIIIFSQSRLLLDIIPDGNIEIYNKINIIISIIYGEITEITFNSLLTFTISVLFGISVAGITRYFHIYRASAVSAMSAFSTGGVASGIAALHCVACGSLIVGFLASFFSASSLLIFIPYQSTVFGTISIGMFVLLLYVLNKKLT
ncbi:MAG: hypothetical protein DDT23_00742 [candidate division WS2 bacterium]|nr:hypothetical protein [Candidatus Lithacetigena glycinireducens]